MPAAVFSGLARPKLEPKKAPVGSGLQRVWLVDDAVLSLIHRGSGVCGPARGELDLYILVYFFYFSIFKQGLWCACVCVAQWAHHMMDGTAACMYAVQTSGSSSLTTEARPSKSPITKAPERERTLPIGSHVRPRQKTAGGAAFPCYSVCSAELHARAQHLRLCRGQPSPTQRRHQEETKKKNKLARQLSHFFCAWDCTRKEKQGRRVDSRVPLK